MPACFFASDLHGRPDRYDKLIEAVAREGPGAGFPSVFIILGNDDARAEEPALLEAGRRGVWEYVHDRRVAWGSWDVFGYACVPPTPFRLKDWERYDVSRHL